VTTLQESTLPIPEHEIDRLLTKRIHVDRVVSTEFAAVELVKRPDTSFEVAFPVSPGADELAIHSDWIIAVELNAESFLVSSPKRWQASLKAGKKVAREIETESLYKSLFQEWRDATAAYSSMTDIVTHPAYQRIIGMGRRALPLMLRSLKEEPCWLFWALKSVSGNDPVPPKSRGRMREMTKCWLDWGREKGLV